MVIDDHLHALEFEEIPIFAFRKSSDEFKATLALLVKLRKVDHMETSRVLSALLLEDLV